MCNVENARQFNLDGYFFFQVITKVSFASTEDVDKAVAAAKVGYSNYIVIF